MTTAEDDVTDQERRATPRPKFDQPTLIPGTDKTRHLWGDETSGFVLDRVWLSSERLHVLEFSLPVGGHFGHSETNPTIFAADELLYVLEGEVLLSNPSTGETQRAEAGEALFFRRDTWHHGRAGGDTSVTVLEFFSPPPATGASSVYARQQPYLDPADVKTIDERILLNWPMQADRIRTEQRITPIRESDLAWANNGELQLGFLASTEHLSVMRCRLRAGAAGPTERHPGEEFVLLLSGALTVWTPEAPNANCLHLGPGDGAVLPPQTIHRYINTGDHEAVWLCGLGPGLTSAQDIGPGR